MEPTLTLAGLISEHGGAPVARLDVAVEASVEGGAAEIIVRQRYQRRSTEPVHALYVFPLPPDAAVVGFSADVAGRRLVGRLESRDAAREVFERALEAGDHAFLLDQDRPDLFAIAVGVIEPGGVAEITIRYVTPLHTVEDAARLTIPTCVAPRYTSPEVTWGLEHPLVGGAWTPAPDGELKIAVTVAPDGPWRRCLSPSHPVAIERRDDGAVRVSLAQADAALDRDFVVSIERDRRDPIPARVARAPDGTRVVMATFRPDLHGERHPRELRFVVDCSGSMAGAAMTAARAALVQAIRLVGVEDTFTLSRFGTRAESLWRDPRPLTDANLAEALRWVAQIDADLGGTELGRALRAALTPRRACDVVLVTDGLVGDVREILEVASGVPGRARVFVLGVGEAPGHHLLQELAASTGGAVEIVAPGEAPAAVAARLMGRIGDAIPGPVSVDWGGATVDQVPATLPALFSGERVTVLGRVIAGDTREVTLAAGGRRWTSAVDLERAPLGGPIPALWARAGIRALEARAGSHGAAPWPADREDALRDELIALSRAHGVQCSQTSWVAVAPRSSGGWEPIPRRGRPEAVPVDGDDLRGSADRGAIGDFLEDRRIEVPSGSPPPLRLSAQTRAVLATLTPREAVRLRERFGTLNDDRTLREIGVDFFVTRQRIEQLEARVRRGLRLRPGALDRPQATDDSPPPGLPAPPDDLLLAVLATQRADGSFRPSTALDGWLEPAQRARLRRALARLGEAPVATSTIVALCRRAAPTRERVWRAAVHKARAWLARADHPFDAAEVLDGALAS